MAFSRDVTVFLISSFLPGEYVLRIFPLICKATQSVRFSLSLLATSYYNDFDFENEVYGISSKWQDFARILQRGHTVTALLLEDDIFQFNYHNNNNQKKITRNPHPSTIMPHTLTSVQQLVLFRPKSSASFFSTFSALPRLTKLALAGLKDEVAQGLLPVIWKLSTLTSLTIRDCKMVLDDEAIQQYIQGDYDAPAFAQSLTSLESTGENSAILDLLAPYCRNLTHILTEDYHEIMINNPALTSLWFCYQDSKSPPMMDLTPHTKLIKLHITNPRPFSSRTIHSHLEEVSFYDPLPDCASQFLAQCCPQLKKVSVDACEDWSVLVKIISVLNPDQCKQLQLDMDTTSLHPKLPSVDEVVELVYKRGFTVNDEFLMNAHDASKQWERIMKIAPNLKHIHKVNGCQVFDQLLLHPPHPHHSPHPHPLHHLFASFQALSRLNLNTKIAWDQQMISTIATTCSNLKTLIIKDWGWISKELSGVGELHSTSLRKVDLSFESKFSGFDLNLPSLTNLHLNLCCGEGLLLQGILDADNSLIQLPLLRVLSLDLIKNIENEAENNAPSTLCPVVDTIHCKAGHRSLIKVKITGKREAEISKLLTFRNTPSLREIEMDSLPSTLHIVLDIPGDCDVLLADWTIFKFNLDPYHRRNYAGSSNFGVEIAFTAKGWIEIKKPRKNTHRRPKNN